MKLWWLCAVAMVGQAAMAVDQFSCQAWCLKTSRGGLVQGLQLDWSGALSATGPTRDEAFAALIDKCKDQHGNRLFSHYQTDKARMHSPFDSQFDSPMPIDIVSNFESASPKQCNESLVSAEGNYLSNDGEIESYSSAAPTANSTK